MHAHAETLADTVNLAVSTHPQIREGAEMAAAARHNVAEQRSGYFPVLAVQTESGRIHNNDMTTRADTPSQGASASWKQMETVTLSQPLFTGFNVENRVGGAQDRYAAAQYDLAGTEEDVALRAARAHLNLMRTKALLDLASSYEADIETRRKNIALMVKEGAAGEADLLQAEAIAAQAQNTQLGYKEAYQQAAADYIEVAGTAPAGQLELGAPAWERLMPATIDQALAVAVRENSHILSADKMVNAAMRDKGADESGLMPQVSAEVSYTKINQKYDLGGFTSDAAGLVKMAWSFSTGGGQFQSVDKYDDQEKAAVAKRDGIVRTVEHDVRQKFTAVQTVDQQYALLTRQETESETILQNFLAQFQGGKQSNLQLIQAHSRLFDAQAAQIDASYRRLLARFQLLDAMGDLRAAFGNVSSTTSANAAANRKG
ncbi:MAG: TolC family protein [Alphaproteobacteria bacterium]|nr:TolC family protein [Alphaproteobacteria bacterium]